MQQVNEQQAPSAFPKLPKSDLFSRLESFLPAMAQENKRLEEAVAAGHGHEHNIEVEEAVEEEADADSSDEEEDAGASAAAQPAKKKRIIEMNFALGVMDNASSDADSSDDEGAESSDKALKAALAASKSKNTSSEDGKQTNGETATGFEMRLARPSHKPRPVIQELN